MTTFQFNRVETLEMWTCNGCGVVYGMTTEYIKGLHQFKRTWYCPNGCSRWFGKSETDLELARVRVQLEQAQEWERRSARELENERRSHAATKGQLTKTRNRVKAGLCPDCRRHFVNLERHMASKHGGTA